MKVYLKRNPPQIGLVKEVYCTEGGQTRMTVEFAYSKVDADVSEFELFGGKDVSIS